MTTVLFADKLLAFFVGHSLLLSVHFKIWVVHQFKNRLHLFILVPWLWHQSSRRDFEVNFLEVPAPDERLCRLRERINDVVMLTQRELRTLGYERIPPDGFLGKTDRPGAGKDRHTFGAYQL